MSDHESGVVDHRPPCTCNDTPECQSRARVKAAVGRFFASTTDTRDRVDGELYREAKKQRHRAKVRAGEAYRHEAEEQRDFVARARKAGWRTLVAVNGTRMHAHSQQDRAISWSNQQSLGASKGAPDLVLVHPLSGSVCWIELKRVRAAYGTPAAADKQVSDEQREWLAELASAGQWAFVGWGADDAWRKLQAGPGGTP